MVALSCFVLSVMVAMIVFEDARLEEEATVGSC